MDKIESAVAGFREGFNCAQAVLSAYGPDLGLPRETCLKIAAPFGAGMARTSRVCGAVSGALMALGLKFGATRGDDLAAKEKTYAKARELMAGFEKRHGSIICRELIGCDLATPEGLKQAIEKNLFNTHCARFVQDAVLLLDPLLR